MRVFYNTPNLTGRILYIFALRYSKLAVTQT